MPEHTTAENLLGNIMDRITESVHYEKSGSIFMEEKSNHVAFAFSRHFGRQQPVHRVLGNGKYADCLLWRNKKISASVLSGATVVWVMFEWLNYNFLPLLCFASAFGMLIQFLWSNGSSFMNRSPSDVPRIQLPDEWFVNIGTTVGREVNRVPRYLQNISCSGNLKSFILACLICYIEVFISAARKIK